MIYQASDRKSYMQILKTLIRHHTKRRLVWSALFVYAQRLGLLKSFISNKSHVNNILLVQLHFASVVASLRSIVRNKASDFVVSPFSAMRRKTLLSPCRRGFDPVRNNSVASEISVTETSYESIRSLICFLVLSISKTNVFSQRGSIFGFADPCIFGKQLAQN